MTARTSYTLTARPTGDGPFTYQWSNGSSAPSITMTAYRTVRTTTGYQPPPECVPEPGYYLPVNTVSRRAPARRFMVRG